MSIPKLGNLKKVENLKNTWEHEALAFTPWLAEEENIQLLADAIGATELVVEAQEKKVGPFRADILCKDVGNDTFVLVENQLEKTDHTHLGQILTYAAGLGACTIVWIAKKFTEEHRKTLDWLNEITDEKFHFYGLEIELWQIGNSQIAPKFNVVSKPNDLARQIKDAVKVIDDTGFTERDLLLQQFWTALQEELVKHKCTVKTQKPLPQSWTNAAVGRSSIWLSAVARIKKGSMSVQLAMNGATRSNYFEQLFVQKAQIEQEIGYSLIWLDNKEDKQENHIRVTIENINLRDKEGWQPHLD